MNQLSAIRTELSSPPFAGVGERSQADDAGLCFVLDGEPAVGWLLATALTGFGVAAEHFTSAAAMLEVLGHRTPDIIFLDLFLGDTDAIDILRQLAGSGYAGAIQIMSGRETILLDDVRRVGARHGLQMLTVLPKPFRLEALRRILEREQLVPLSAATRGDGQAAVGRDGPKVDLGEAIRRNWLELWYQPKLDLRSGIMIGAEGLARIRHPDYGVMLPESFLSAASHIDLLLLAESALHVALRDARDFAGARPGLRLAINVPVGALVELPIPSIVREYRPNHGEWDGIVLEITEDQAIRDIDLTHDIATQLRSYRVAVSIDDFGHGPSAFARLKDMPFAELKLDRSFVADCGNDQVNAGLCKTAVDLAHRFGSLAVAGGVEKAADLVAITRTGCDIAQGFIFAHAMPKDFLIARLHADSPAQSSIAMPRPEPGHTIPA
jgi:EAL domain-containing protein (putative c-di-GMP-specific phosphodiesterase class I)